MRVEDNIGCVVELSNSSGEYEKEKVERLIGELGLEKVGKNLGEEV